MRDRLDILIGKESGSALVEVTSRQSHLDRCGLPIAGPCRGNGMTVSGFAGVLQQTAGAAMKMPVLVVQVPPLTICLTETHITQKAHWPLSCNRCGSGAACGCSRSACKGKLDPCPETA